MSTNTKRKTATAARKGGPNPQSARARQIGKPTRTPRTDTKQAKVLSMLKSKSGATVPAIMNATGWQKHSVLGFFSGVVRKRLGLTLVSEVKGDTRVYRIVSDGMVKKGVES